MEPEYDYQHSNAGKGEKRVLLTDEEKKKELFVSFENDMRKGFLYNARLSKWYLVYCAAIALMSLLILVFTIVDIHIYNRVTSTWTLVLDGILTFCLCFETAHDMFFLRSMFWKNGWHVFDFMVAILSLIFWITMLMEVVMNGLDAFVTVILITCRYLIQAIRIFRLIRSASNAKETQASVDEEQIRFDGASARSF